MARILILFFLLAWPLAHNLALAETVSAPNFSADEISRYASQLSPLVAGRSLSTGEREAIQAGGYPAFTEILKAWTLSPSFPRLARQMLIEIIKVGGKSKMLDPDLPGNLAEYLAKQRRPYSEILTAESCYDRDLNPTPCDAGAPFTAGILSTRSFLKAYSGRFNLKRAIAIMEDFTCLSVPIEDTLQPRETLDSLIPLFARTSDVPDTAPNSLGFGRANCYKCHGQFSAHAQLFVKFDNTGMYRTEAQGQQSPDGQPGESKAGTYDLFTSHFKDSARSQSEASQVFGQPVSNLREAAQVIVSRREFRECAVRRTIAYGMRLERSQVFGIDGKGVKSITEEIEKISPNPSFSDLFYITFKNARVIAAALGKS